MRSHRERAARRRGAEFLFEEVASRLAGRLAEVVQRRFSTALVLGPRALARRALGSHPVERLISLDAGAALLAQAPGYRVAAEPDFLPLADRSLDLALVLPWLHWIDDLPGAFVQLRRALKPDGFLLGAVFGGETLTELRQALMEAELAEEGGASPRISIFTSLRDVGHLLQRAGFALPVVDAETLTATYADAFALMRDLRAMGESNALAERRRGCTRRATLARAAALYAGRFGTAEGRIPATFEVLYFAGWAPHPDQPKPLRPGSAAARLADALGAVERKGS